MDDFKWFCIAGAVIFSVLFLTLAYDSHAKSECHTAGFVAHQSAADIQKVCGE